MSKQSAPTVSNSRRLSLNQAAPVAHVDVLQNPNPGIRAGLTLHMVERPPEAAAAAAPAPGPTGGVPTTGGVPQVRPASIMMGTITLPNQAGGTPPGLDNVWSS